MRWNAANNSVDDLVIDSTGIGVNSTGIVVGLDRNSGPLVLDGSLENIFPGTYQPLGGISDTNLSAGIIGDTAALYRLNDPLALLIPGILDLGLTSEAVDVLNESILGNTDATTFLFLADENELLNLNSLDFIGDDFSQLDYSFALTGEGMILGKGEFNGEMHFFRGDVTTGGPPGDYNDDGLVNAADYTVWRDHVGGLAGTLPNDPHDAVIGPAQYDTWRQNFGAGTASATAVPEPGACMILVCILAAACMSDGRRRSQVRSRR